MNKEERDENALVVFENCKSRQGKRMEGNENEPMFKLKDPSREASLLFSFFLFFLNAFIHPDCYELGITYNARQAFRIPTNIVFWYYRSDIYDLRPFLTS